MFSSDETFSARQAVSCLIKYTLNKREWRDSDAEHKHVRSHVVTSSVEPRGIKIKPATPSERVQKAE